MYIESVVVAEFAVRPRVTATFEPEAVVKVKLLSLVTVVASKEPVQA